jgi:RHS repeat-associated protein
LIQYYEPDIVTAQDYYPFWMMSRVALPNSGVAYSHGFNGKWNDNEVKGLGNQQDYGMRVYDPRLARFLSVDPITKDYPWYTPYQYAGNTPIQAIDLDGLEELKSFAYKKVRFVVLKNVDFDIILRKSTNTLTTEMISKDKINRTDYSVNLQMYEKKPGTDPDYYTATKPQPNFQSQGFNNKSGKNIEGRSSKETFYFSIGLDGKVTAGMGDAPLDSKISFGGGVPIYVNGLKYGEDNVWKPETPSNVVQNTRGAVAPENKKYLLQKSSKAYLEQSDEGEGKTILAHHSKLNLWLIVSQEDGLMD